MPEERTLWAIATSRWRILSGFTLAGLIVGAVLIVLLPREYRVRATALTVAPDGASGIQSALGQLGSLASIVGLSSGQDNIREEAIALLKSDRLAWQFLTVSDAGSLLGLTPDVDQDEVRGRIINRFKRRMLSVQEDRRTGLITVSMQWRDRNQAATWANAYVRLADDELRSQTLKDAERTLDLLTQELEHTDLIELRSSISRFYESQLQRMLFTRARDAFTLRVIDPAMAPAENDTASPNKKLILASALILGGLSGLLVAVASEMSRAHRALGAA
jgi:uncharacterized protein involved in exopolysaccharide biosynthesis